MIFTASPEGIDELMTSAEAAAFLTDLAGSVKTEVEQIAPRHSGHYADSIEVSEPVHEDGGVVVYVYSTDFAAHIVELGSVNNPPYRPLTRGAANLGLEVQDVARR